MRYSALTAASLAVVAILHLAAVRGDVALAATGEYILGTEDVVAVTVWEHPELSRTVVVRADGTVTLPPLGDVPAAGKTTAALARELESRIYSVLRIATQATVAVVSFNSRTVYLAGQVSTPGRYSFETIPNIVDLMGMAGGFGPQADLANVRIMRKTPQGGTTTITADLTGAMEAGDQTGLPALEPGDVVFVPATMVGGAALGGDVVHVLGAVAKPGPYSLASAADLYQLFSLAGGVLPNGNLSEVEILAEDVHSGGYRVTVDLERHADAGRKGLPLQAGDTVIVPARSASPVAQAWTVIREGLGLARDVYLIREIADR